ncbi:GQ67_03159T0 [Komagataella phaffii]|nr:GQ67_03159T0 [Komagataella phaffii]AOA68912.1 GQ68_03144T0 [Komagataella phaffii GS115]
MRIQSLCCFVIQSVDGVTLFHRDINILLTNHQTPKEVDNSILNLLHEHRICAGDSKLLYTKTKSENLIRLNTLKKITQHGLMMKEKIFGGSLSLLYEEAMNFRAFSIYRFSVGLAYRKLIFNPMSDRVARYKAKREEERAAAAVHFEEEENIDDNEIVESKCIPCTSEYQYEPERIIKVFQTCFQDMFEDQTELNQLVQSVKGDLYNRDYAAAFGEERKRDAYVIRWSPARALAYSSLFSQLKEVRELIYDFSDEKKDLDVLAVGGGAGSELVALNSIYCFAKEAYPNTEKKITVTLVDIADWSLVVDKITDFTKKYWLYKTATYKPEFVNHDILKPGVSFVNRDLITLLFTTNELFAEDRTEATKFLQRLSSECKSGALLLIAESAGSFSHIQVGKKKFPLTFLIDTILCGRPGSDNGAWTIIDGNDSVWYRTPKVQYDLKLENMRFFYRLYRKR